MRSLISPAVAATGTLRSLKLGLSIAVGFLIILELGARTGCASSLNQREALLSQNSELVQRDEEDGKWSDAPKAQDWAPTMRGNPFLLWEYAPGQRTESDTDVNINSLGLRGPEPTIPKPDGIRRLLSTGDSTIYGFKVRDGSVFIDIAAEKLGPDVEGWNAAIPGYSSYQSLNMLEMRALKLEPDVIVIGNIWSDNNFDTFVDKELLEVYSLFQSGTVNHLWGILEKSAIFRVLDYRLRLNQDRDLTEREKRSRARKVGWTVGGQDQNSGKRRVAANDYATNLNSLIDLAHSQNAEAILVTLPHPFDLIDDGKEAPAWALYRKIMQDVADSRGVPLVNMVKVFQASGEGREALFFDEGEPGIQDDLHPSELGHRLMGEALAATLKGWSEGQQLESDGSGIKMGPYSDPFVFDEGDPTKVAGSGDPKAIGVSGRVDIQGFQAQNIQIDAVLPGQRPPKVIGTTRIKKPGSFEVQVPHSTKAVTFIVYEDLTGNGPTADDLQSFFGNNQWTVAENDEGVELLIQH
jgi:lysophospholipase L1-like esterase